MSKAIKTVKASIGQGANKIEFKMPIETAEKVIRLKAIIKKCKTNPIIS